MFSAIPLRYDLINRLLTGGFDARWRRRAACECIVHASGPVLDLCCGTGDLSLHLADTAQAGLDVFGLDFSGPMLIEAVRKSKAAGLAGSMAFLQGDAANLPFPDDRFSVVGISFAFRNLTYRNRLGARYLSEVLRVLSPGGKFVIVETGQPRNALWRGIVHAYYTLVVSPIGGLISGQPGAYRYLAHSARGFYSAREMTQLLLEAGFSHVDSHPLLGGVAALSIATKQPGRAPPGEQKGLADPVLSGFGGPSTLLSQP